MKKLIVSILFAALTLTLIACGGAPDDVQSGDDEMGWQEHYDLGMRYLSEGNYQEAIIAFTAAIEIDPMNPRGYTGAAEAYAGLNQMEDAINILKQGLEMLPGNPAILEMLADIYIKQGRNDEANTLLQKDLGLLENNATLQSLFDLVHTHNWIEATCTEPKTCADCKKTEGDVEHTWLAANYQEPQICSECAETGGSPLTPSFVEHGIEPNAVLGTGMYVPQSEVEDRIEIGIEEGFEVHSLNDGGYSFVTVTSKDEDLETIGTVEFCMIEVASSYEGYEAKDGYEFVTVYLDIYFRDDNALNYGFWSSYILANYYETSADITSAEATSYDDNEDSYIPGFKVYGPVNYYGEDLELHYKRTFHGEFKQDYGWAKYYFVFYAPIGYDGIIVSLVNYKNSDTDMTVWDVLSDNAAIFRIVGSS